MIKTISKISIFSIILASVFYFPLSHATCWNKAGEKYQIEPRLLKAIAQVESGMNPQAIGKNNNGSYDIGLMQINSSHLNRLKKIGVTEEKLINDPCTAVMVGASILKEMIVRYGYGWEAVGAYNVGNCKACYTSRMKYAEKVWRVYLHEI